VSDPAATLERRYRRLLAFYPRAFRRENDEEIVAVLMACAAEGQRWPRLADSANLLRNAIWMRLRRGAEWELSHRPGVWVWVRALSGLWLLMLTVVLCGNGRWWGLALLAPAAFHLYRAHRLGLVIERRREAGGPPPPGLGAS